ncbi:hypothetical protein M951_chr3186 (nucleomorph) [Lotharella oceanica]|uniref:Uncharacterized protein n=1 Tax=Lotharella oceanica TaxID=641309 RepID=A0A060DHA6_9EUKA|nr:hypothetical protein M951_chr119 [Lotharella oceanica]AIB09691.1 hypothetical protein M951_chr1212 [Lotharella oceanica]AIB09722.1 hypothetical protein M951_chr219 [Lotharella oceanica]AIB09894.1 hypothetical protein M951_chr2202 [Lotharella oceanica]AIB09925.1 hypothetical protein M951_chr319 [Lotharella oceanica]
MYHPISMYSTASIPESSRRRKPMRKSLAPGKVPVLIRESTAFVRIVELPLPSISAPPLSSRSCISELVAVDPILCLRCYVTFEDAADSQNGIRLTPIVI